MSEASDRMILIEGLDLTGKSTLCQGLLPQIGELGLTAYVSHNKLSGENSIGRRAEELAMGALATKSEIQNLFFESHVHDAVHFNELENDVVHIQDSSWLRTVSYNIMTGTPLKQEQVNHLFKLHPSFGTVIYLASDLDTKIDRLLLREAEDPRMNSWGDKLCKTNPDFVVQHDKLLEEITHEFYPHVDYIDTTEMNKNDMIEASLAIIEPNLPVSIDLSENSSEYKLLQQTELINLRQNASGG